MPFVCDRRGGTNGGVPIVDMLSILLCEPSDFSLMDLDPAETSSADARLLASVSFTALRGRIIRPATSLPFLGSG